VAKNKAKYADWTKEDLINRIQALEKRKKYGLVWDEERTKEKFEADAQGKLPVLKEIKSKEIKTDPDKPTHILIEGDNYHALSVLCYTHEKSIDVIYIDPPYNTGNKSWKYNNDYVEKDDAFRHSKWLSFMGKRLALTRRLLKESGIILVTIDDYEMHTLKLLMDQIFGESNRLGTITIVNKPEGRTDDKFIPTAHEYMLVYGRNANKCAVNKLPTYEEEYYDNYPLEDEVSRYKLKGLRRGGANSRRQDRPNLYYPIYFDPEDGDVSLTKVNGDYIEILPIDSKNIERCWRWGNQRISESRSELVFKKVGDKWDIFVKSRAISAIKATTVWNNPKYNPSAHGTKLLEEILGRTKAFDYPKSLYAVIDAVAMSSKNNSVVLDFFAGSGTTGHAVLELNKRDGGNREFILCTNNENGICEEVCYPRITSVIKGYRTKKRKKVEGLRGNLKYFRTAFVPSEPTDKNKELLTKQSVEMLCLRESTFDFVSETDAFKIYKNKDHYTGIIFDQLAIPKFKKAVSKYDNPVSVYVFSLGDDDFSEEFADMKKTVKVCSIPEAILRVYRRIFK